MRMPCCHTLTSRAESVHAHAHGKMCVHQRCPCNSLEGWGPPLTLLAAVGPEWQLHAFETHLAVELGHLLQRSFRHVQRRRVVLRVALRQAVPIMLVNQPRPARLCCCVCRGEEAQASMSLPGMRDAAQAWASTPACMAMSRDRTLPEQAQTRTYAHAHTQRTHTHVHSHTYTHTRGLQGCTRPGRQRHTSARPCLAEGPVPITDAQAPRATGTRNKQGRAQQPQQTCIYHEVEGVPEKTCTRATTKGHP